MSCLWSHLNFIYTSREIISSSLPTSKLARTTLLRVLSPEAELIGRNISSTHCYGCQTPFPPLKKPQSGSNAIISEGPIGTQRFVCPSCHNHYCIDCDLFCHEVLHNCPGCERSSQRANGTQIGEPMVQ
jgi:transcription factor Ssl1